MEQIVNYGEGRKYQYGRLRYPRPVTGQRARLAIIVHGGCWSAMYPGMQHTEVLAKTLTDAGFATWNLEYRRVEDQDGGWPGTYHDVYTAATHVIGLFNNGQDLDDITIIGYSAGGHLALWLTGVLTHMGATISHTVVAAAPAALQLFIGNPNVGLTSPCPGAQAISNNFTFVGDGFGLDPIDYPKDGVKRTVIYNPSDAVVPGTVVEEYIRKRSYLGEVIVPRQVTAPHGEMLNPAGDAFGLIIEAVVQG